MEQCSHQIQFFLGDDRSDEEIACLLASGHLGLHRGNGLAWSNEDTDGWLCTKCDYSWCDGRCDGREQTIEEEQRFSREHWAELRKLGQPVWGWVPGKAIDVHTGQYL